MSVAQIDLVNKNHLIALYQLIKETNDIKNAEKMLDLYEKFSKNQFNISFSGHFSAGKSSFINYLLEKEVLPKSPIPTSANIVKISSGAGVARVYFHHEQAVEYQEPYDIDMIKDFCMNKDTIKQIEIQTSEEIIPKNSAILDTPGIDAADDADRIMTESSLHLIDVLCYVMDYNHVQSEVNFYFLQKIQEYNIPFYIIINQIDKHNEAEIPFVAFDRAVKQTFDQWSIRPEKIFYSSVKYPDAPHNDLNEIKQELFSLLENQANIHGQIKAAMEQIIKDHEQFLRDEYELKVAELEQVEPYDEDAYEQTVNKLAKLDELSNELQNEFNEELNQTLNNAYIMPAKLRDIAADYLETEQKDFKVGFFNAKRKTAEVQQARISHFYDELKKSIESTVQWKLRDKLLELLRTYQINDDELMGNIQNFTVDYQHEDIRSFVKRGATINGNYILNYTNDISNDIKNKFRQKANDLLTNIIEHYSQIIANEKAQLSTEKDKYEKVEDVIAQKTKWNNLLQEQLQKLHNTLTDAKEANEIRVDEVEQLLSKRMNFIQEEVPVKLPSNHTNSDELTEILENEVVEEINLSPQKIITSIEQFTTHLAEMDSLQSIMNDLADKKVRLQNRQLTIALFGAFSAGKSSFSNALFGEAILPVSPNPTTAVISRINPVTDSHQHGTVIITFKNDNTLTKDIRLITNDLRPKADDFTQLVEWIKQENVATNNLLDKTYQSYLTAILAGYEDVKMDLGATRKISLEQFAAFVTDEAKACYIETVDLYYDCALTRKGVTLVDTPGADSVNARHTNVSFDYIKDADAIIYVTYYNHAITSADRDFLIQLGRVKEAFELDKMFFIVNAADLAETEEELQLVLNYVDEQLVQFGVRNAKIFPVSSKQSLLDKTSKQPLNEQMSHFERSFYEFIENDLAKLTVQAAVWDMKRAESTLASFIKSVQLDENERTQQISYLKQLNEKFNAIIDKQNLSHIEKRTVERIERQIHFVLERLFIRFHDMFTEFYNPTTVTDTTRQVTKQLEQNRNRLIDYVGYELLQEVRAVSLRLEAFIKDLLKSSYEQVEQEIRELDERFTLASFPEVHFTTPEYAQAFTELDLAIFAPALKVFRNLRSFFEQNQREKMKDAFYEILQPEAKIYLDEQQSLIKAAYEEQVANEYYAINERLKSELTELIEQHIKVLTNVTEVAVLEEKYRFIQNMLNEIGVESIA